MMTLSRCNATSWPLTMCPQRSLKLIHEKLGWLVCLTLRVDIIQRPLLHFDVEACSTATRTRGVWILCDLELGSNQLHREVYLASLEQL
jgi:hypothetical protein